MPLSPAQNLIRVLRKIIAKPKHGSFRVRYGCPGGTKIRVNQRLQTFGPAAQSLVQGGVQRFIEMSIAARGNKVGVRPQDIIQNPGLKFISENIDLVRAQEAERMHVEQLVPELFQTDRGGRVPGVPQEVYHFTVRPEPGALGLRAEVADERSYAIVEALPVRLSVTHESDQCLARIAKNQAAIMESGGRVEAFAFECLLEQSAVISGSDNHSPLALS